MPSFRPNAPCGTARWGETVSRYGGHGAGAATPARRADDRPRVHVECPHGAGVNRPSSSPPLVVGKEPHVVMSGTVANFRVAAQGARRQAEPLGRGAEGFEEPLEGAARSGRDADDLTVVALHAVGVRTVPWHEAEVARREQFLLLEPSVSSTNSRTAPWVT